VRDVLEVLEEAGVRLAVDEQVFGSEELERLVKRNLVLVREVRRILQLKICKWV
jgi:hypothetical protein